jgi:hypothetical protein
MAVVILTRERRRCRARDNLAMVAYGWCQQLQLTLLPLLACSNGDEGWGRGQPVLSIWTEGGEAWRCSHIWIWWEGEENRRGSKKREKRI